MPSNRSDLIHQNVMADSKWLGKGFLTVNFQLIILLLNAGLCLASMENEGNLNFYRNSFIVFKGLCSALYKHTTFGTFHVCCIKQNKCFDDLVVLYLLIVKLWTEYNTYQHIYILF